MKFRDLRILLVGYLILSLLPISGFSFCAFYNATGYPCPGCGMTRAIHSLLVDQDILYALKYHPLSLVLTPMLVVATASFLIPNSKIEKLYKLHNKKMNSIFKFIVISIFIYGLFRMFFLFIGWPEIEDWFAKFQEPTIINWLDSRFFH